MTSVRLAAKSVALRRDARGTNVGDGVRFPAREGKPREAAASQAVDGPRQAGGGRSRPPSRRDVACARADRPRRTPGRPARPRSRRPVRRRPRSRRSAISTEADGANTISWSRRRGRAHAGAGRGQGAEGKVGEGAGGDDEQPLAFPVGVEASRDPSQEEAAERRRLGLQLSIRLAHRSRRTRALALDHAAHGPSARRLRSSARPGSAWLTRADRVTAHRKLRSSPR